jgi:hypothetical protein
MVENKKKQKLVALGAECLADGLLDLAVRLDAAKDLVERMIATPIENIQRFKKKIIKLKRSNRFVHWGESSEFANELEALLQDLKAGVNDPITGVELVASFYETDHSIFENCDDSGGWIGNVYRFDAKELFSEYAIRCIEKEKIANIILKVTQNDNYGVRDTLIECAKECLPEKNISYMIAQLQKPSDREDDEYTKRHTFLLIESLARQIKDAKLFEQTRIASWGKLSTASYIDISRVYLESGDTQTALSWIDKIPEGETYQTDERDQLLLEIYKQLGDDKNLIKILYRQFRAHHTMETLQELLDTIGEDKKNEVLEKEVVEILAPNELSLTDAQFLIAIEKINEAETYLLERADQLNGDFYTSLLELAKTMQSKKRNLAASIIYRKLLLSILKRAYTKAYPYGVRYLKKLDSLATLIPDWTDFDNHEAFKDQIYREHGRKRSFWQKYEVKNE